MSINASSPLSSPPPVEIVIHHGKAFTTSLDIAEKFGKKHKNVLRDIAKISQSKNGPRSPEMVKFNRLNFEPVKYLDAKGESRLMYNITRDGFTFLAMGFNGDDADHWKVKYIAAFNAMEQVLIRQANASWQELRAQGKTARLEETDTIRAFVEYASKQGSTNAKHYYKHITEATYKALFFVKAATNGSIRDLLDNMQLSFLQTAEYVAQNSLTDGMAKGMDYHDIYQLAKNNLVAFANTVGATPVVKAQLEVTA